MRNFNTVRNLELQGNTRLENIGHKMTIRHEHDIRKITKTRHDMKNNMNTIRIHKYVKKYVSKSI